MQRYLLVGLGGALGSVLRFWVGTLVSGKMAARFPYGTFVVNVTACVLIGFCIEFFGSHLELSSSWRLLFVVGFIGAYSTFSTFEWETFASLQIGNLLIAGLYLCLSITIGLAGIWGGVAIARTLP